MIQMNVFGVCVFFFGYITLNESMGTHSLSIYMYIL